MKGLFVFACIAFVASLSVRGAEPVVFTGRIVAPEGSAPDAYTVCLEHHEGRREHPPATFLIEATPEPDGAFRIEAPPRPQQYTLYVRDAQGHAQHGVPHLEHSRDFGDIRIRADGAFFGMARLPDGTPAAGVAVRLERKLEGRCSHFLDAGTMDADPEGQFAFEHLNPGQFRVRVLSDAYTAAPVEVLVSDGISYIEVHLSPAAALTGRVVLPDGQPVSGAQVHVRHARTVETDADGRFRLPGLGAGRHRVSVHKDGLAPVGGTIPSIDLADRDLEIPDLVLAPTGALAVSLQTEPPGRALPAHLSIRLEPQPSPRQWVRLAYAEPVENGVARFAGLPAGRFTLKLDDESLGTVETDVTIESGRETEARLTLPEVHALRGRVLDESGEPVTGVNVLIQVPGAAPTTRLDIRSTVFRHARTDDDGRFAAQGLPRGEGVLSVQTDALAPLAETVSIPPETAESTFVLHAGLTLSGRLVDEDGTPVPEATLVLRPAADESGHSGRFAFHRGKEAESRPDGRFVFSGVNAGTYQIELKSDAVFADWEPVAVAADSAELGDWVAKRGLAIAGAVTESDGTPAAGLRVSLFGQGDMQSPPRSFFSRDTRVNADGTFHLGGLPPGAYRLDIQEADSRASIHSVSDVAAGSEDLIIILGEALPVRLRVTAPDGTELPDADIQIARMDHGRHFQTRLTGDQLTDSEGQPRLRLRVGAHYEITARRPPWVAARQRLDLTTATDVPDVLELNLRPGVTVAGTVVDHAQQPVAGVYVSAGEVDPVPTDAEGRFRLEGVAPGANRLTAHQDANRQTLLAETRFMADATHSPHAMHLALPQAGRVQGVVRDDSGEPLAGAMVMLHASGGRLGHGYPGGHQETDATGRFTFDPVLPGRYMLMAMPTGFDGRDADATVTPKMRHIEVEAGETVEADLPESASTGATLAGIVTLDGAPLPDVQVLAFPVDEDDEGQAMRLMGRTPPRTDATGRFELSNVGAGEHLLLIFRGNLWGMPSDEDADAFQYGTRVVLTPDQAPMQVAVSPAGLAGIVEDPQGQPVSGANLTLAPATGDAHPLAQWILGRQAQSDAEGRFSMPHLDPLDYQVTVVDEAQQRVAVQTLNATTDGREHRIRLAPGLRVSGSVAVDGGEPPAITMVFVYAESGQLEGAEQVGPDGAYAIAPLPPGRRLLFALAESYSVGSARLELDADATADFVLSPPGSVAVTLDGPEPLRSGRDVRLEDEQGREVIRLRQGIANLGFLGMLDGVFLAPTDSEGKTTVHGLPAGVYRVFVEGHDVSARVTVEPLQTAAAILNIGEE